MSIADPLPGTFPADYKSLKSVSRSKKGFFRGLRGSLSGPGERGRDYLQAYGAARGLTEVIEEGPLADPPATVRNRGATVEMAARGNIAGGLITVATACSLAEHEPGSLRRGPGWSDLGRCQRAPLLP